MPDIQQIQTMANQDHLKELRQGVDYWNAWIQEETGLSGIRAIDELASWGIEDFRLIVTLRETR